MHPHAGGWDLSKAPALAWSDGDLWNVALDLEAGAFVIQFQAGVCVCGGMGEFGAGQV